MSPSFSFEKILGCSQAARLAEDELQRVEAGKAMDLCSADMKGFVYILQSIKDKRTYTGSTPDLERRIAEHNSGKCFATKKRCPLKLVYFEEFPSIQDARKRERYLKSATGRRKIKDIFKSLNILGV